MRSLYFIGKITGCLFFTVLLHQVSVAQDLPRARSVTPVIDTIKGLPRLQLRATPSLADTSFGINEKVAIDVTVDGLGNVISAAYQSQGSTTDREEYVKIALKRVYRMKFSRSNTDSKGTIILHFRVHG